MKFSLCFSNSASRNILKTGKILKKSLLYWIQRSRYIISFWRMDQWKYSIFMQFLKYNKKYNIPSKLPPAKDCAETVVRLRSSLSFCALKITFSNLKAKIELIWADFRRKWWWVLSILLIIIISIIKIKYAEITDPPICKYYVINFVK